MSMRYRILASLSFVVIVTMLVVVFVSCGKSQPRSTGAGWSEPTALSGAGSGAVPVSRTLAQVIAEIEAYEPPGDVDTDIFAALTAELVAQITRLAESEGTDRLATAAPTGDSGRVTDLAYDPDSDLLTWSYVNVGDYDLSGEVGISDITPIAQNYLAITDDGIGDDGYEAWLDGDGSGEIGISDITLIAENYMNDVMEYRIVTSDSQNDGFTGVGEAVPYGEQGAFPKTYSVTLPDGASAYIAVEPVGADLAPGERSNVESIAVGEPPDITDVQPRSGEENSEVTFTATVTSTTPLTYSWDFGGGATPNTSTEESPIVTLADVGSTTLFDASLTVTNDYGEDLHDFTLAVNQSTGEWHIETVDSEGDVGYYNSIALDSGGYPHVSYFDYTNKDLKYAYMDASGWHIETVDSEGEVGWYTSIALESGGYPHLIYLGGINNNLKYAYMGASGWNIEIVDSGLVACGGQPSIAVDSGGYPHVSYFDDSNDDLKYAYMDPSGWHIETVDSEGYVGWDTSIAIDSSGYPHLSYNFKVPGYDLKYAFMDASGWHIETVDSEGYVGRYTSIALDSEGYPHVSYWDRTNDDLKYAYMDASGWHTETVDSEGDVGEYTSIALDSDGYPHVSYRGNYDLKYAYMDASGWHIETFDSYGWVGYYASLALDSNGYAHLSYCKSEYGNHYLRYAYLGP